MSTQNTSRLHAFATLHWYDETIKFIFNFVTKTSELLLAAGIVVSTANFLTDGSVMQGHAALSDAWAWAQAIAIDSSLGIVFINAFQALRERDKIRAIIFFTLTALLATVAGLITHFDALGHAAGLPVSDKGVSGVIPLWIMTALRAVAVIGFLLTSRLKNFSFNELRDDWHRQEQQDKQEATPQIDYNELALALQGIIQNINVSEEKELEAPSIEEPPKLFLLTNAEEDKPETEPAEQRIAQAYEELLEERTEQKNDKPISARDLAQRAKARRATCSTWLKQHEEDLQINVSQQAEL
ncbi:hypothetical protein [Dictyobacter kobayashii]|uniref:DUF2637 domain-containing protein n=1 Tax=Dictyobacter kobayashii TaxID=2014872 RepID=A0A402AVF6_9CHLR|nr:hypothetical protein [Dictyobacter kobayashii]GCE23111.1 hypothetical protein KDK_69110 [Dictyobacter kobayashii]